MKVLGTLFAFIMAGMYVSPVAALDDHVPDDNQPGEEDPGGEFPEEHEPELCEIQGINTVIVAKLLENTGCECDDDASEYERCLKKKTKTGKIVAFIKAATRAKVAEAGLKNELRSAIEDEVQTCEETLLEEDPEEEEEDDDSE